MRGNFDLRLSMDTISNENQIAIWVTILAYHAASLFLGLGMPVTKPSLGSLIRAGQEFFFSGSWWITVFPGIWLVVFVLVINLLGDWLRDVLNPKLYKG